MKKVNWIKVLKVALGIGACVFAILDVLYIAWAKAEIALASKLTVRQHYQLRRYQEYWNPGTSKLMNDFIQDTRVELDDLYQEYLKH